MESIENNKKKLKKKVAIIIPSFKASKTLRLVVEKVFDELRNLKELYNYKLIVVDDSCPEKCWETLIDYREIKIIHNKYNLGVGGSTLKGIEYALENNFDAIIKLDADGQHPPKYLKELIPYIFSLPKYELFLTKGTRYKIMPSSCKTPPIRRIGTLFLDPIARMALSYRGLSDVTNGFLGLDAISAKFLLYSDNGIKIKYRYLFESSLLAKCSELGFQLNEFCILPEYGDDWYSSMNAFSMIIPLLIFWFKTALNRIIRKYFISINLGSLLLLIAFFNINLFQFLFFRSILPGLKERVLATAGTSAAFIGTAILSIISITLFLFYDYSTSIKTKIIYFKSILNENEFLK